MDPTLDEVAAAYRDYGRTQDAELFWAFEAVLLLAFEQRWDDLWDLTVRAVELTDTGDTAALAFIAAGPLEDLVRYAAPVVEARIVERIRSDAKFRRVLTGVWARDERADFWMRVSRVLDEFPADPLPR